MHAGPGLLPQYTDDVRGLEGVFISFGKECRGHSIPSGKGRPREVVRDQRGLTAPAPAQSLDSAKLPGTVQPWLRSRAFRGMPGARASTENHIPEEQACTRASIFVGWDTANGMTRRHETRTEPPRTPMGCPEHWSISAVGELALVALYGIIHKVSSSCASLASFAPIRGLEAAILTGAIRKVSLFILSLASFASF
jgi:hypothetical protein